jgi:hypothetical protein
MSAGRVRDSDVVTVFGMPVFAAIVPRLCPRALSSSAYSILSATRCDGAANHAAGGRGAGSGVGGAFGSEGAFHLGVRVGRGGTRRVYPV